MTDVVLAFCVLITSACNDTSLQATDLAFVRFFNNRAATKALIPLGYTLVIRWIWISEHSAT